MDKDELDELMSIDPKTRRDAEAILFALEQAPDGFNTTTCRQMEAQLGCGLDMESTTSSTFTRPSCCSQRPMASSSSVMTP